MNHELLADEKRRLIRIQASVLRASKEPHDPATDDLLDAVAQLTLVVAALLKEHTE